MAEVPGDSFPLWSSEDPSVGLARMLASTRELLRLLGDTANSPDDERSWQSLPPAFSVRGHCLQMMQLIEENYAQARSRFLTNMSCHTGEPNPDTSSARWLKSRLERVTYLLVVAPAIQLGRMLGAEQLTALWPDTGVEDEWPEMHDTRPDGYRQDSDGAISELCQSYCQSVGECI